MISNLNFNSKFQREGLYLVKLEKWVKKNLKLDKALAIKRIRLMTNLQLKKKILICLIHLNHLIILTINMPWCKAAWNQRSNQSMKLKNKEISRYWWLMMRWCSLRCFSISFKQHKNVKLIELWMDLKPSI